MLDPERDYTDSDLAALEAEEIKRLKDFTLGEPALVCRWRLAERSLPLANRHMRALGARTVNGAPLTPELLGWVRQHVEWTLGDGAWEHPDGVLMLVIDKDGHAAMSLGEFESLADASAAALRGRARLAASEQAETGVAPEVLFAERDGAVVVGLAEDAPRAGAVSLVVDLASTLGVPVSFDPTLADSDDAAVFLVSDEHGVVPASDGEGSLGRRFSEHYAKLLASTKPPRR